MCVREREVHHWRNSSRLERYTIVIHHCDTPLLEVEMHVATRYIRARVYLSRRELFLQSSVSIMGESTRSRDAPLLQDTHEPDPLTCET